MRQPDYFAGMLGAVVLSVPFYFIWNKLAPIYFYQIPEVYQRLPFWHCAGLFLLAAIFRSLLVAPVYYSWFGGKPAKRD